MAVPLSTRNVIGKVNLNCFCCLIFRRLTSEKRKVLPETVAFVPEITCKITAYDTVINDQDRQQAIRCHLRAQTGARFRTVSGITSYRPNDFLTTRRCLKDGRQMAVIGSLIKKYKLRLRKSRGSW